MQARLFAQRAVVERIDGALVALEDQLDLFDRTRGLAAAALLQAAADAIAAAAGTATACAATTRAAATAARAGRDRTRRDQAAAARDGENPRRAVATAEGSHLPALRDRRVSETMDDVIVDNSDRLHVRVHDRRSDELETSPLQILAPCIREFGPRRNVPHRLPPLDESHGKYPIVLFIHGTAAFRTQSLTQMTHWASRGFVVISADHPKIRLKDALGNLLGVASADQPGEGKKLLAAATGASGTLAFPGKGSPEADLRTSVESRSSPC